jgi:hypothetical protein
MILGFNHNVNYKGEVFHVQTEDSGTSSPNITTLLYKGGVILCSKKTSYADILKMSDLETVVEELMKEQHKDIMRRLKSGEFDDRAFKAPAPKVENVQAIAPPPPEEEPLATAEPAPVLSLSKTEISRVIREAFQMKNQISFGLTAGSKGNLTLDDAVSAFFESRR